MDRKWPPMKRNRPPVRVNLWLGSLYAVRRPNMEECMPSINLAPALNQDDLPGESSRKAQLDGYISLWFRCWQPQQWQIFFWHRLLSPICWSCKILHWMMAVFESWQFGFVLNRYWTQFCQLPGSEIPTRCKRRFLWKIRGTKYYNKPVTPSRPMVGLCFWW